MAAAQDSGGEAAAGRFYDEAGATFTTLIDEGHAVTSLYGMVNVPMGVWIDEQGRVVRPPEVAYAEPISFGRDGEHRGGHADYTDALRNWVRNGAGSRYALAPDLLAARLMPANPSRTWADAHFQLAVWLHEQGHDDKARLHWATAQELAPEVWNYHRQDWSFRDTEERRALFTEKLDALDGPYYEPVPLHPAEDANEEDQDD